MRRNSIETSLIYDWKKTNLYSTKIYYLFDLFVACFSYFSKNLFESLQSKIMTYKTLIPPSKTPTKYSKLCQIFIRSDYLSLWPQNFLILSVKVMRGLAGKIRIKIYELFGLTV